MSDIRATRAWPTNAHMIADVAKLGYLDGAVLDATYGEGNFWTVWRPVSLTTNDLWKPADHHYDFRAMGFPDHAFHAVVFDPPYKLSGTPALGQFDYRYGTDKAMTFTERMALLREGALECARVASSHLLIKCQDQVVSGRVYWQTDYFTSLLTAGGWTKVDRFDFVYNPRPQPGNRRQQHARRNSSQLLVFAR